MSAILYARVSTDSQAEKDLSIPAQFRSLRELASREGLAIAGEYQDVSSGRSFRGRGGLLNAMCHARSDRSVEAILVHKVDRLARNVFDYFTLKSKLRSLGIRIVSCVEHFEDNPMGEFIESIMAAQAEFYSANLALEVKKGLEERRRKGLWSGLVTVGYNNENGHVQLDPARAQHVRYAFERWATGTVTSTALAEELHQRGFVSRHGHIVPGSKVCGILKNPFYAGIMKTRTGDFPGKHPPLISQEIFQRCQEVFRQKGRRGTPRRHLDFLLTGLVRCPHCASHLVGEQHVKKSGKVFRYYRCHRQHCRYSARVDALERMTEEELLKMKLPERLLPRLRIKLRRPTGKHDKQKTEHLDSLRQQARQIEEDQRQIAKKLSTTQITEEDFDRQLMEIQQSQMLAQRLLTKSEPDQTIAPEFSEKIKLLEELKCWTQIVDAIERKRILNAFVDRIIIGVSSPLRLRNCWLQILDEFEPTDSPPNQTQ